MNTDSDTDDTALFQSLASETDDPRALNELGRHYSQQKDWEKASRCFRRAIRIDPKFTGAWVNLGATLRALGKLDEAYRCYEKANAPSPDSADVLSNFGNLLIDMYRPREGVEKLETAHRLKPENAKILTNLGAALRASGELDRAIEHLIRANALNPLDPTTYNNMGTVCAEQGRFQAARENFEAALSIDPEYAAAHLNRGYLLLSLGSFGAGWAEYAWRFRTEVSPIERSLINRSGWDGSSLTGRTILVWPEQGLGDEIMFATCLQNLLDEGKPERCLVACDPRLVPLFERTYPSIEFFPVERQEHTQDELVTLPFDVHVSMGGLVERYRRSFSDFPDNPIRLLPNIGKVEDWSQRLSTLGNGLKVGIAWRGGGRVSKRRRRFTSLSDWCDLLAVEGIHWVNLQYDTTPSEILEFEEVCGSSLHHWPDLDLRRDIDEVAALVANLDIVIQMSNASAHLAGALGTTVWNIIPFAADWRWFQERTDALWYPSMRLFRQERPADWGSVLDQVAVALREPLRSPAGRP